MTYQVLARKWRPREFSSLIGQQAVVTALTNALREGRIAQAYLFSGIRGVGKTTAARLFAKALNCEQGPENGPCNACATCAEITAGADLDVLEIDAATYSKVEQVRELAESLKYGPARDPYKVVVLDEVHRLSRQAFDALLKIVEEPPPRLVFIFATTEIDAVPATILSRCQEFHFRRVAAPVLIAHLKEISAAESITANETALALIARAGEGSVRDAVALLDQLATFGNGTIAEAEAARLVGGLDLALFANLLDAILAGDAPRVAELGRQVENEGWDPRQVHAHFLGYCRDALHLVLDGDPGATDLPAEEAARLARTAKGAGYENMLRLLHHLLGSEASVRRSDASGLALELAWLRAAELPKLSRIEELLSSGSVPAPTAATATASAPRESAARAAQQQAGAERSAAGSTATRVEKTPVTAGDPPAETPPAQPRTRPKSRPQTRPASPRPITAPIAAQAAPPAGATTDGEAPATGAAAETAGAAGAAAITAASAGNAGQGGGEESIMRFREELSTHRPMLAAQIENATLAWADGELRIALAGDDSLTASQLARQSNRELLSRSVAAIFGAGARYRIVAGAASPVPPAAPALAERERVAAEDDTTVQSVLDIFGGAVEGVARAGTDATDTSDEEGG